MPDTMGTSAEECHSNGFYVSSQGKDTWSGRLANPNRKETDGPFATLGRARDAIRESKKNGGLPPGGLTVWIRSGAYAFAQTLKLTSEDSGTAESPIAYRAFRNEKVIFTGGRELVGFKPVRDPAILERLDPAARGHVLQVDLKALGIADYGALDGRGYSALFKPSYMELFCNGRPMQLARWPNKGWARIAAAETAETVPWPAVADGKPASFFYSGDRPARWAKRDDMYLHGYWTYPWADSYERIVAIDTAKKRIVTAKPGVYGYAAGRRFYALNILEELDCPGEWYVDRNEGILYFWPPKPIEQSTVVVSLLQEPMIRMDDVSYVTLQGIVFEYARGTPVVMVRGSHDLVASCAFRNLGSYAVCMADALDAPGKPRDSMDNYNGGSHMGITGCEICNTGAGGIIIAGGDRKTLVSGHNYVTNNHIHHFARISRTYNPAVNIVGGVGTRVAHNSIHDSYHSAIIANGNDFLVEFNEIYNVVRETEDAGAFYMGRNVTYRGVVIRHNFFHHLGPGDTRAIYADDFCGGVTIYGNVFCQAGRAVAVNGGQDHAVENNLFIDCRPALYLSGDGVGYFGAGPNNPPKDTCQMERYLAVNPTQPLYSERYPALKTFLRNEPYLSKNNRIARNINVGKLWMFCMWSEKYQTIENNLEHATIRFADPLHGDFRMLDDDPAKTIGFQPIPFDKIGLYRDRYRARIPARSRSLTFSAPRKRTALSLIELRRMLPPLPRRAVRIPKLESSLTVSAIKDILDRPVWTNGIRLSPFVPIATSDKIEIDPEFQTTVWVAYDERNLYMKWRCHDPDAHGAQARSNRDDKLWYGDGIEFFLLEEINPPALYQFVANPNGRCRDFRWFIERSTIEGDWARAMQKAASVRVEDKAWTLALALPWERMGGAPKTGEARRVNCCRTRQPDNEHNAWSPVSVKFTDPADFGLWRF